MSLSNSESISVSELSRNIRTSLEDNFGRIKVRGEITSLAKPSSGHLYFSLVDPLDNTRIQSACWRGVAGRLQHTPQEGDEVIVTAKLTSYGQRSQYQLIIEQIELAGMGALLKILEERRKKLLQEGLFAPERKKPLPTLPKLIGVITSEKGAVWQDILHRIEDRFPRRLLLCPVTVQGDTAARQICSAIEVMNSLAIESRPDVLIIARGGGSVEDLMPFQEESVVRAVAASDIPIVSAIGHETDTTLIDHAADLRAPTPTAAAEMVVPVRKELLRRLEETFSFLKLRMSNYLEATTVQLNRYQQSLGRYTRLLENPQQQLDMASIKLHGAISRQSQSQKNSLSQLFLRLKSPKQILDLQQQKLTHHQESLCRAIQQKLHSAQDQHQYLASRITPPETTQEQQKLKNLQKILKKQTFNNFKDQQTKLDNLQRILQNTSFSHTLSRGFVLAQDQLGKPLTRKEQAQKHEYLTLRFVDGELPVYTKIK